MADNSIEFVLNKMINQMRYNRQIYSLNELLSTIYTQDFSGSKTISVSGLDTFLSEFGIFLTKNEQSTQHTNKQFNPNDTLQLSRRSDLHLLYGRTVCGCNHHEGRAAGGSQKTVCGSIFDFTETKLKRRIL